MAFVHVDGAIKRVDQAAAEIRELYEVAMFPGHAVNFPDLSQAVRLKVTGHGAAVCAAAPHPVREFRCSDWGARMTEYIQSRDYMGPSQGLRESFSPRH